MAGLIEDLPWETMSPRVLEELVYALAEELGSAVVQWRSSSNSINESDGGRDIEAVFNRPTPDGDVERETWWFECKQRDRPLSPSVVKTSILNSIVEDDIACFIIATNSSVSNATTDWIEKHNRRKAGPVVKVWDRKRLQSLVTKHPSAAARTLVNALPQDEQLAFLAAYFFESSRVLSELELSAAWGQRSEISDGLFLVAACYADVCGNKIEQRPWLSGDIAPLTLMSALTYAYTSLIAKVLREEPIANEYVVQTCAYILGVAAVKLPHDLVGTILDNPFTFTEGDTDYPQVMQDHIITPCKEALLENLLRYCSSDCRRYDSDSHRVNPPEDFWRHFTSDAEREGKQDLIMIKLDSPCHVGLPVSDEILCPLESSTNFESNTDFALQVGRVIEFRQEHSDDQRFASPGDSTDLTPGRLAVRVGSRVLRL